MNELVEIKVGKTTACLTLPKLGELTMKADAGRETKRAGKAIIDGNRANIELCEALARIKSTESYKSIVNADGVNVTPTFGDYAEKILAMSKGGASNYASVGELFREHLRDGWKYGHFVLMLKLRKITDANGEALTADDILELLEERGATPASTTRELDSIINNILCEDNPSGDDGEEEEEKTETDDDSEDDELEHAFNVIRNRLEKAGNAKRVEELLNQLEKAVSAL